MKINIFISGARTARFPRRSKSHWSALEGLVSGPYNHARPDKSRFYFNDRPQSATERSVVFIVVRCCAVIELGLRQSAFTKFVKGKPVRAPTMEWRRKRSLVVVAARSNWELNCDNKARKAHFFYVLNCLDYHRHRNRKRAYRHSCQSQSEIFAMISVLFT